MLGNVTSKGRSGQPLPLRRKNRLQWAPLGNLGEGRGEEVENSIVFGLYLKR